MKYLTYIQKIFFVILCIAIHYLTCSEQSNPKLATQKMKHRGIPPCVKCISESQEHVYKVFSAYNLAKILQKSAPDVATKYKEHIELSVQEKALSALRKIQLVPSECNYIIMGPFTFETLEDNVYLGSSFERVKPDLKIAARAYFHSLHYSEEIDAADHDNIKKVSKHFLDQKNNLTCWKTNSEKSMLQSLINAKNEKVAQPRFSKLIDSPPMTHLLINDTSFSEQKPLLLTSIPIIKQWFSDEHALLPTPTEFRKTLLTRAKIPPIFETFDLYDEEDAVHGDAFAEEIGLPLMHLELKLWSNDQVFQKNTSQEISKALVIAAALHKHGLFWTLFSTISHKTPCLESRKKELRKGRSSIEENLQSRMNTNQRKTASLLLHTLYNRILQEDRNWNLPQNTRLSLTSAPSPLLMQNQSLKKILCRYSRRFLHTAAKVRPHQNTLVHWFTSNTDKDHTK